MTIRHSLLFAALLMALPLAPVLAATPQAATVTYQGQLKEGGQPFTGTANFDFRLFDAETGGNLIAQFDGVEYQNYPVLDGLLQVELPFIAADFNGDARWLEIRVNGAILDPRQPLTSTPYAVRALGVSALALDGAELQAGAVSLTKLAGNAVNSSKIVDGSITAADINSAERAVERQMMIVLSEFKRGSGILGTVGSTAPFVGLLGTTMGIVNAFQAMSLGGASGGLAGIGAGIAEALITTAFGLLVAIPAVWAYNYFTTKVENLSVEMTYTSKELIDYLIKSVGSEFGRSIFTKEFQAQKAVSGSGHIHG